MKKILFITVFFAVLETGFLSHVFAFGPNVLLNQPTTANSSTSTIRNINDGNRNTIWAGTSSPSISTTTLPGLKYVTTIAVKMKVDPAVQTAWIEYSVDYFDGASWKPWVSKNIRSFHSTPTGYLNYPYYYGNAKPVKATRFTFYRGQKMVNNQWVNMTAGEIAEIEMYEN